MITDFDKIANLMEEIDMGLACKVELYIIGGAALMHYGIKPATKDIDIIVSTKEEFRCFEKKLKEIGFKPKLLTKEYSGMDISQILVREDFRIDLFLVKVCRGFSLTKEMKHRAKSVLILRDIKIFLCSLEDIFLFKTLTEREGDIEDCMLIAKKGLDWDSILKELQEQIKISKREVWATYVGERLEILSDRGVNVPINKEIRKMIDNYYKAIEK